MNTALDKLQASFDSIQHSFRGLHLLLNSGKTKCMIFIRSLSGPPCTKIISTLDGSVLDFVYSYKYLGIWLNSSLSFHTHINKHQSKIKSRIGFLFRNRASFTIPAKHALVNMTILPILDFGDVVYRSASNTLLRKLDGLYQLTLCFVLIIVTSTHLLAGPPFIFNVRHTGFSSFTTSS